MRWRHYSWLFFIFASGAHAAEGMWVGAGYGAVLASMRGYELEAVAKLDPKLYVGGGYLAARQKMPDVESEDVVVSTRPLDASMIYASARYWPWGDVLHVTASIGMRTLATGVTAAVAGTEDAVDVDVTCRSAMLGAVIGSQWTVGEALTLGADWLGYAKVLGASTRTMVTTRGETTEKDEELGRAIRERTEALARVGHARFLVLKVGYLF